MKGIITDIQNNRAVVLSETGEFINIPDRNYIPGQTVTFRTHSYTKILTTAACFILFFTIGFGGYKYYKPTGYINININPSIQLRLNAFQKIIKVVPLNEDAEDLLNNSDGLSDDIEECITQLTDNSRKLGYLNESNKDITIEIISDKKDVKNKVESFYDKYENKESLHITVSTEKSNMAEVTLKPTPTLTSEPSVAPPVPPSAPPSETSEPPVRHNIPDDTTAPTPVTEYKTAQTPAVTSYPSVAPITPEPTEIPKPTAKPTAVAEPDNKNKPNKTQKPEHPKKPDSDKTKQDKNKQDKPQKSETQNENKGHSNKQKENNNKPQK